MNSFFNGLLNGLGSSNSDNGRSLTEEAQRKLEQDKKQAAQNKIRPECSHKREQLCRKDIRRRKRRRIDDFTFGTKQRFGIQAHAFHDFAMELYRKTECHIESQIVCLYTYSQCENLLSRKG